MWPSRSRYSSAFGAGRAKVVALRAVGAGRPACSPLRTTAPGFRACQAAARSSRAAVSGRAMSSPAFGKW
jgi:hypothetical protein